MAKQKGRELLVKIGDGGTTEIYTALAGLTAKSITINTEEIDVTTADATTPGGVMWAEVLDGVKRLSISGTGTFIDATNELRANTVAMATPPTANFQLVIPNFGYFTGAFFLSQLQWSGDLNGGVAYDMTLASSGAVTFTAT